jgi:SPW repeat
MNLTTHRSWEDWLLLALGALILLSPWFADRGYQGPPAASALIVGLIIIFVAELEIAALSRWEEVINLMCGAWIMAAPVVLQYSDRLRIWHFGLGGLVVIITVVELWQDKRGGGSTT